MSSQSYRDLTVWQQSKQLTLIIYQLTYHFPPSEDFGLTSQMRRAAMSIPSNIAEGFHRTHRRDKHHSYTIAYGSAAELECQLEIAVELYPEIEMGQAQNQILVVMKLLNAFIRANRQATKGT